MGYLDVLGVRRHWCQPGEPILCCVGVDVRLRMFDVGGLKEDGTPQPGLASRALRGLGWVVLVPAAVVLTAASADDPDTGRVASSTPHLVVWGRQPECEAVRLLGSRLQQDWNGFVVVTPTRVGWFDSPPQEGTDTPVEARPPLTSRLEFPALSLAGPPQVVPRKLPRKYSERRQNYLRLALHDGSGFDLLVGNDWHAERVSAMLAGRC